MWFGETFYYIFGFPWNLIRWAVAGGLEKFSTKIRKRWRTSNQITHLVFHLTSQNLLFLKSFSTFAIGHAYRIYNTKRGEQERAGMGTGD